jgi:hypothetical protein
LTILDNMTLLKKLKINLKLSKILEKIQPLLNTQTIKKDSLKPSLNFTLYKYSKIKILTFEKKQFHLKIKYLNIINDKLDLYAYISKKKKKIKI